MKISEEVIRKIKEQNDIVDVIAESVKLKRSGRNYMGLCPFHHEKSPSFSISSEKQIYKCFGCGEQGNAITFIMKYKNLPFTDALKYLGERVNITIDLDEGADNAVDDRKEKLYKINVEAARYFFNNLTNNKDALAYFKNRGITEATRRKFGLGYASESWNDLLNYLKRRGSSELELISSGLISKSEKGSIYDRFRNRIIFPVFDYKGKVIGFGGRVLNDSKPKYLNSPETLVFFKGANLYGLNFAIKDNLDRSFIIVEGYMDCISLHQNGITNAVASLGTALTQNQAKLLKRYGEKVIIAYDADLAGQMATLKGLEVLRTAGFDVRVLTVPSGKDPDEYIRNNGREAFLKLVKDALPLIEYRIKRAGEDIDFNNNEKVIQYTKKVTEILVDLDPVEKDVYVKKISEDTGIKEQAIYDLMSGEIAKNVNKLHEMNIVEDFGQKLYLEPAYLKAERILLKLMLMDEDNYNYILEKMPEDDLVFESHKRIYKLILLAMTTGKEDINTFVEDQCDDVDSLKEWIYISNIELIKGDFDIKKLINDYVYEVKKFKLEESKKEIMAKIKECEAKGLVEESINLAKKLIDLQKSLGRD